MLLMLTSMSFCRPPTDYQSQLRSLRPPATSLRAPTELQGGTHLIKQRMPHDMAFESEDPLEGLRKSSMEAKRMESIQSGNRVERPGKIFMPPGDSLRVSEEQPVPHGGWESDEEWPQQPSKGPHPPTYPSHQGNFDRDQFSAENKGMPNQGDQGGQEWSQSTSTSDQESYNNILQPEGTSKWDRFTNKDQDVRGGGYYHSRFSPQDRQCYTNINPQDIPQMKQNSAEPQFGPSGPGPGLIGQGITPWDDIRVPSREMFTEKVASYLQGLPQDTFSRPRDSPEIWNTNSVLGSAQSFVNSMGKFRQFESSKGTFQNVQSLGGPVLNHIVYPDVIKCDAKNNEDARTDSFDWDDSFDEILAGQNLTPYEGEVEGNEQNKMGDEMKDNSTRQCDVPYEKQPDNGNVVEGAVNEHSGGKPENGFDDNVESPKKGTSQESEDRTGLTPRIDSCTGLTPSLDSPGIENVRYIEQAQSKDSPLQNSIAQMESNTVSPLLGNSVSKPMTPGFKPIERKMSPSPGGIQPSMGSVSVDHMPSHVPDEQREPVRKIVRPTAKRGRWKSCQGWGVYSKKKLVSLEPMKVGFSLIYLYLSKFNGNFTRFPTPSGDCVTFQTNLFEIMSYHM